MQGSWKRVGVIGLLVLGGCPTLDVDVKPIECEPQKEVCDGIDNDCNGEIDEDVSAAYFNDTDGDGYGDSYDHYFGCSPPDGYVMPGGDCDELDASVNPGAIEVCDGIDNDCTGTPDEGVETVYYPDLDEDGYGSSEYPLEACDPPEGYVENDGDPDDYDPDVP